LRGKYQHFDLNLIFKTSISNNSVYKYEEKNQINFNFKGPKLTREAKNSIFIAISFKVNRNTVWKLKIVWGLKMHCHTVLRARIIFLMKMHPAKQARAQVAGNAP
jgi:hypothetical protein